jgi:transcriptional regulator with XRE-family HTH domain
MDKSVMAMQIRAARAALKWKQAELAQRSGISEPAINRIERGESEPRYSTFSTILSTFRKAGITLDGSSTEGFTMFFDTKTIFETINNVQKSHRSIEND